MASQLVLFVLSALLVQISGQCINAGVGLYRSGPSGASSCGCGMGSANSGLSDNDWYGAAGSSGISAAIANAGAFGTSSSSPMSPSGVSVLADSLLIEGPLTVAGDMPFLTAVALNGALATSGSAGVSYSAGNGNVGILSESSGDLGFGGSASGFGNGAGAAGLGYGAAGTGLDLGARSTGFGYGNGARMIGSGATPAIGLGNRLGLRPASLAGCRQ